MSRYVYYMRYETQNRQCELTRDSSTRRGVDQKSIKVLWAHRISVYALTETISLLNIGNLYHLSSHRRAHPTIPTILSITLITSNYLHQYPMANPTLVHQDSDNPHQRLYYRPHLFLPIHQVCLRCLQLPT